MFADFIVLSAPYNLYWDDPFHQNDNQPEIFKRFQDGFQTIIKTKNRSPLTDMFEFLMVM